MEQPLKLLEVLKILRKQKLFVVSIIVSALLGMSLYLLYIAKPMYEANTQLLINQKTQANERYSWDQTEADLKLINTYYVIVKSPIILNEVIVSLGLTKTPKELEQQITIANENDSTVINLTIRDSDPMLAVQLANTLANVFEKQIPQLMNVNNVQLLSKAELSQSEKAVSPNRMMYMTVTAILSILGSIMLAFIREMLNKSVRDDEEFEQLLNVPIIGVICTIRPAKNKFTISKFFVRRKVRNVEIS